MTLLRTLTICVIAGLAPAACGGQPAAKTGDTGPHGGFMLALDNGRYFAELCVDPAKTEMTVHLTDGQLKKLPITDAPKVYANSETLQSVAASTDSAQDGSPTWVFVSPSLTQLPHGDFEVRIGGSTLRSHVHPPHAGDH